MDLPRNYDGIISQNSDIGLDDLIEYDRLLDETDESHKYDREEGKLYCDICGKEVGSFATKIDSNTFHCLKCIRANGLRIQTAETNNSPFPVPRTRRRYGKSTS